MPSFPCGRVAPAQSVVLCKHLCLRQPIEAATEYQDSTEIEIATMLVRQSKMLATLSGRREEHAQQIKQAIAAIAAAPVSKPELEQLLLGELVAATDGQ